MNTFLFSLFASIAYGISNHTLHTVNDCSSGSHIGHIESITMTPSSPVAGQEVILSVDYVLDSLVTGGEAKYTASFNGFPLSPTTEALCPDVESSTPCPIAAGKVHYESPITMGDSTTHGTLVATTTWTNQDGLQIICWGFTVRI